MPLKQVITIDGTQFDTLEAFFACFQRLALNDTRWGNNLDAFNDVLRGGFGTPDGGFVLLWKNHELSRQRLGYDETVRQLRKQLENCHPRNVIRIEQDLALALEGRGPTVFDWLLEVIATHGGNGAEKEDGIELRLE